MWMASASKPDLADVLVVEVLRAGAHAADVERQGLASGRRQRSRSSPMMTAMVGRCRSRPALAVGAQREPFFQVGLDDLGEARVHAGQQHAVGQLARQRLAFGAMEPE
jgi:hypothetical protein